MLWEVDIYPGEGHLDRAAERIAADAAELGLGDVRLAAAHGYLVQGSLGRGEIDRLACELLADTVVERTVVGAVGDASLAEPPGDGWRLVHVLPKPGVMDPVAQSALSAIADFGFEADAVSTLRKYWLAGIPDERLEALCAKILANDAVEQVVVGPLTFDRIELGSPYRFHLATVPLRAMDDDALARLSREGQLYLSLVEMQTIQAQFRELDRDPTDVELETIAQTWSEHCSHKTLAGRISYRDEHGTRDFQNMLKETIFASTQQLRRQWGDDDWCVSVFEDNAGVIRFDDQFHVVFKVETHNHPSALEPYGGANTGLGGVIRDPLGTGLGAKPVANTDVFCFAPPDTPPESLPQGVLHPKRVMKGVVAGVRDYGNRMGIPTVNGAVCFDPRYLGNPLVFCGNVGLLPCDKVEKAPQPGDHIVVVGGRTGRDGIHGATFSSAELTSESETLSGGAVQIGNAITEKMVLDVLLAARDAGLYHAITDCGAGGLSSAIGEMGEHLGAEVQLDRAPLKYEGLSYTEIWISEAQERMVVALPPENWPTFSAMCQAEGVEATVIGTFVPTGRLVLKYGEHQVADLAMKFLHDGRPPVIRAAHYTPVEPAPASLPDKYHYNYTDELLRILGALNVASKEWIIRQYDHEVQGGSVVKPLVGARNDGPSDAAVVRPVLSSRRGIVVANGINPHYGDHDTYHMAASALDEAVRNCVAVGADPSRIAILDNFCWGDCERPETLGSLVRAALACHDVALAFGTPFISGKDSLNKEFRYADSDGTRRSIAIPPTLLISAIGQVDNVARCVTMDLKEPGNFLFQVGATKDELGGSHFALVESMAGGDVPRVDAETARATFTAIHAAISSGAVRACHDLSEGGLAAAAAEMAFAGDLGARVFLGQVPYSIVIDPESAARVEAMAGQLEGGESVHALAGWPLATAVLLFAESNSRFLCEVRPDDVERFASAMGDVPHALVGEVTPTGRLEIVGLATPVALDEEDDRRHELRAPLVVDADLTQLKEAWQAPLRW